MPAIHPARLKIQVEQLVELVSQPAAFVRGFKLLMEQYADWTHRSGQSGNPPPLLNAYNPPPQVIKQIFLSLRPTIQNDPQSILAICDALWPEPNLECRMVASSLLGQVQLPDKVVIEKLQAWLSISSELAEKKTEERILKSLLDDGLAPVRRSNPNLILSLSKGWLDQKQILAQQAGLQALRYLAAEPSFDNFPGIYRLINPMLRITSSELRVDLLELLYELVERAPSEAAYVLKQNLTASDNPDTPWLVRQVMSSFPEDIRASLRKALTL